MENISNVKFYFRRFSIFILKINLIKKMINSSVIFFTVIKKTHPNSLVRCIKP